MQCRKAPSICRGSKAPDLIGRFLKQDDFEAISNTVLAVLWASRRLATPRAHGHIAVQHGLGARFSLRVASERSLDHAFCEL